MKRKLKYMYITKESLAEVLKSGTKTIFDGLPNDAEVINMVYRPEYDVFHIVVYSKTFPEVKECDLMTQLTPQLSVMNE